MPDGNPAVSLFADLRLRSDQLPQDAQKVRGQMQQLSKSLPPLTLNVKLPENLGQTLSEELAKLRVAPLRIPVQFVPVNTPGMPIGGAPYGPGPGGVPPGGPGGGGMNWS